MQESKEIVLKLNKDIEQTKKRVNKLKSICHTWFIVKDKGMEINWKKPLIQKS
jgi:hypothetical protein